MDDATHDLIAIDSNAFVHVLNPAQNTDNHIVELLLKLQVLEYLLCVDENVVRYEYEAVVKRFIRNQNQQGDEVRAIGYWLDIDHQHEIRIDKNDAVYRFVEKVIKKHVRPKDKKNADWRRDCMFVAVACTAVCSLVSNDLEHIHKSRQELLDGAHRVQPKWEEGFDIETSLAAHRRICGA